MAGEMLPRHCHVTATGESAGGKRSRDGKARVAHARFMGTLRARTASRAALPRQRSNAPQAGSLAALAPPPLPYAHIPPSAYRRGYAHKT